VYENMGFALSNKKVPRPELDRRVRAAAAVLGLSDLLGRKPQHLSGGQRQRVAMGRAIVRSPSVFLMDEPLSNLDAKLRVQMRSEVLQVHRSVGATTMYVTHDQVEAMTMGDRVAVLRAGVLQQYGTPRELYDAPANVFVATFIGSPAMNLYEAALEANAAVGAGPSAPAVVLGSQRLALPAGATGRLAAYQGRKIIVGLRPEDLSVPDSSSVASSSPASPSSTSSSLASSSPAALVADVRMVEALGSEQHAYFSVDATPAGGSGEPASQGVLADSVPNGVARLDPRAPVRTGTRVTFAVDAAHLHFFDPDTGKAIG
jgi:multiple sugar transport system ATP-binding protein